MDALLDSHQQRGNHVCGSIDDLQGQLHHFLLSKSSDTRAEHASLTFELRYNVVFHINTDSDNGRSDSAEPAQSQPPPSQQPEATRPVAASETIQDQPSDDPILQKAVAKHIIGKISMVDGSTWNVRQVARGAQGWTFTYICKDSHQAWSRANAKNPERPVIGSFSGNGGLDPINLSRPAFDCRGTLSIAFSKTRRGVIVQYDHTLLHKTVGQLVELFAPAPAPAPVPVNGASTRTPSTRTSKAKRPPPAEGEEGSRRKRPRKKGKATDAPPDGLADGAPDGAAQATDAQQISQNATEIGEASQSNAAKAAGVLIVPPAEAARRKETAIGLLTGKGIDPATLSVEQFNIFANQAPQLQEASLEMLAKYGAEKLRIVHPDDKDQAGSTSSTPAQAQSATATPTTAGVDAPSTIETPTKKKRSKKKKSDAATNELSIGNGAVVNLEQNGDVGTTSSTLTLQGRAKRTRGACEICKQNKLKCTKEHPACSICQQAGEQCVYAAAKPRRKSEKSAAMVEAEDSEVQDGPVEQANYQHEVPPSIPAPQPTPEPTPQLTPAPVHHAPVQPPGAMLDPDNDEFIPDPNILSGPVEHHATSVHPADNYYQAQDSLAYPPPPAPNTDKSATISSLTFPPPQSHGAPSHSTGGLTFPPQPEQPTYPQNDSVTSARQETPRRPSMSSRRNLPTTQSKQTPVPPPTIPMQTNNWTGHSTASAKSPVVNTASPTMIQQTVKRQRSRKSGSEGAQQMQDSMQQGMQQAAVLSQAAVPPPAQRSPAVATRSPAVMTRSPYQTAATAATAARTKSRQGHRSQTSTPVVNTALPQPPTQQVATQSGTAPSYSATSTPSSVPNYDPYARFNSTSTGQYSNTSTDHTSSRIPYEPGSYHTSSAVTTSASYSSAPAYDYTRSTAAAPSNPLSHALHNSSGYGNTNSSTSNQWPASQSRNSQSQSSNPYPSTQGYGTPPDQRTSTATTYASSQQQPYSYSSHQSTTNQPQQNWYGFSSANNSNNQGYSNNRGAGYGTSSANSPTPYQSNRSNVPGYSGHGYGSSDEQSIYDLLRASGSGN